MKVIKIEQQSLLETWIGGKWDGKDMVYNHSFDETAQAWPAFVIDVVESKSSPSWGWAWYKRTEDGNLQLFKENWDTSG